MHVLYILNVFSIYLYSILFYHDKANKLVIAKNDFVSVHEIKKVIKNLPWLQYSARQ